MLQITGLVTLLGFGRQINIIIYCAMVNDAGKLIVYLFFLWFIFSIEVYKHVSVGKFYNFGISG